MTGKHTPGPWTVAQGVYAFGLEVVGSNKESVADLRDTPQARANAKLIAAAPAIADALEAFVLHAPSDEKRSLQEQGAIAGCLYCDARSALRAAGRLLP